MQNGNIHLSQRIFDTVYAALASYIPGLIFKLTFFFHSQNSQELSCVCELKTIKKEIWRKPVTNKQKLFNFMFSNFSRH